MFVWLFRCFLSLSGKEIRPTRSAHNYNPQTLSTGQWKLTSKSQAVVLNRNTCTCTPWSGKILVLSFSCNYFVLWKIRKMKICKVFSLFLYIHVRISCKWSKLFQTPLYSCQARSLASVVLTTFVFVHSPLVTKNFSIIFMGLRKKSWW